MGAMLLLRLLGVSRGHRAHLWPHRLGEYPEVADIEQRAHYNLLEMDFGRRLVAKFRFKPSALWVGETFQPIPQKALYPTGTRDPLQEVMMHLKAEIAASGPV